jgi:hypothetical protein
VPARVYRTDVDGTVTVAFERDRMTVRTQPRPSRNEAGTSGSESRQATRTTPGGERLRAASRPERPAARIGRAFACARRAGGRLIDATATTGDQPPRMPARRGDRPARRGTGPTAALTRGVADASHGPRPTVSSAARLPSAR